MQRNYCTFYIVRHGETDWNVKKLVQGHTNVPLNKNGEFQAKNIGKKLKDVYFDAVFSSDLLRAKRTAEIITLERRIAVKTTKSLRERYFGRLEGTSLEDDAGELCEHSLFISGLVRKKRYLPAQLIMLHISSLQVTESISLLKKRLELKKLPPQNNRKALTA